MVSLRGEVPAMPRLPVALVSVILASVAVALPLRPARAQVLSLKPSAASPEPIASYEGTASVRVEAWTKALARDGRFPSYERMLVVSFYEGQTFLYEFVKALSQ